MFTLKSYKDQVYNIGSPSPNPNSSPLKSLPKLPEKNFVISPSKVTLRPKRNKESKVGSPVTPPRKPKRKLVSADQSSGGSPLKKPKMISKEQFDEAMEKERVENKSNIDKVLASLGAVTTSLSTLSSQLHTLSDEVKINNKEVKEEIAVVNGKVTSLQSSIEDTRINLESKFKELEGTVQVLQKTVAETNAITADNIKEAVLPILEEQVIPKVKAELKKEILAPVEAAWNAMQSQDVQEHEHNLIVFNYKTNDKNLNKAAADFLRDEMKVTDDDLLKISLKKVYKLGNGKAGREPPLIIKFGHPSERNYILTFSRNIKDRKISVEKDIPKIYQKQHKIFKELAFKLRNMPEMDYQTQIIFDGHFMRLRYKKKDRDGEKYHYVIHSSWKPPMESVQVESSTIKTPIGTRATPAIDSSVTEKANTAIFMTLKGMNVRHTDDTFKTTFKEYLKAEHKDFVTEVKATKKPDLVIIYCINWEASHTIASQYKDKFMDHEVSFSLFEKTNPSAMHQ